MGRPALVSEIKKRAKVLKRNEDAVLREFLDDAIIDVQCRSAVKAIPFNPVNDPFRVRPCKKIWSLSFGVKW